MHMMCKKSSWATVRKGPDSGMHLNICNGFDSYQLIEVKASQKATKHLG